MGGGGVDIPQRSFGPEWQTTKKGYLGQENQYLKFAQKDPLLAQAYPYALQSLQDVGQFTGPLTQMFKTLPSSQDLINPLMASYKGYLSPLITSGGQLTGQELRSATQDPLAQFASRGNVFNQAEAATFMNRDAMRRQRYNEALQQSLATASGIEGLRGQDIAQRTGLASAVQGLRGGALNQVLGTERAGVQSFSQLTNPILSYLSDLFSSNQNAAAAQSVAGANKSGGAMGGALSSIGSIASAVIPIIAASDLGLKEKVRTTGKKTPEGIPIKTFSYRGDPRRFKGVMAQDVEKVRPDAVYTLPVSGHKLVAINELIGAPFEEIKKARAA